MKNETQKILINGDFLARRLTGIERYAIGITKRLDEIIAHNEVAIVIPKNIDNIPQYKNLEIIKLEKKSKYNIYWKMVTLQQFLLTHREYMVLEFGNICLPFAPGIIFLHDIYCEFFPEDFITRRDKLIRLYNRIQYRLIAKLAKKIVTVSEFSKKQICDAFRVNERKIEVVYDSADHFAQIDVDDYIFEEFPVLKEKPFYFSLGSLSKRKNIKWILGYAVKHPDELFAISGTALSTVKVGEIENKKFDNVIFLGYLTDEKVKALMQKCKAFISPSYYEGFGLTPLEALSCGAKVIIANAASLPEIYGKTAHYIDPYDNDIDLDELLMQSVEKPDALFLKYSYDRAAEQVYKIVKEYTRNQK